MKKLLKDSSLILFFLIIGFAVTTLTYLFATGQKIQVVSPLPSTEFSLDKAPSQSLIGNIKSLSGDVLWQSRVANNSSVITKPQEIQQGEGFETGTNGQLILEFPNIVMLNISNSSKINIVQTLKTNIVISQDKGKVVYAKQNINIPVSIRALDLLININSGEVSINVDKDKSLVNILVKKGSTAIAYKDLSNNSNVVALVQGKNITFNNNTKAIE